MSLLLPSSVRVAVCPDRLIAVRSSGFGRGAVGEKTLVNLGPPDEGRDPWEPAVMALRAELPRLAQRGDRVSLVLSNHFVHYALVPFNDNLSNEAEEAAFARHIFSELYGNVAERWSFRQSEDGKRTRVASGIEHALLDGLADAVAQARLRLDSLQPYLMSAFNLWRQLFQKESAWMALVEPGKLCLSLIHEAQWRSIRTVKIGPAWPDDLPYILERERALIDVEGVALESLPVFLFSPDLTRLQLTPEQRRQFRSLVIPDRPGYQAAADGPFSMALMS